MRRRSSRAGFVLIEMLVAVVIVALLASVAVPIYRKHIKASRTTEATTRIGEIVTACRSYAIANPNAASEPVWPSGSSGIVDLSSSPRFTYALTGGKGAGARTNALRVVATGKSGTPMAGVTITITVPSITAGANPPAITGL
jgi:prepilin-type N-terminal cleavage/methylation domain-containing protein